MNHKHAWRAVLSLATSRIKSQASGLLLVSGLFLLLLSSVGLIIGLANLSSPQDLRQQASSPVGTVEVVLEPPTFPILVNQSLPIEVLLNTQGMQVDGVQLVITLPTSFTNPNAQINSTLPIQIAYQQLEQNTNYNLLKLIVLNNQFSQPFSTSRLEPILKIISTPAQVGSFSVGTDNTRSIVTQHNSDPPLDVLKPITSISILVNDSLPISVTATATPTPPAQCNSQCRVDQDCPNNLFCYFGQYPVTPNIGWCRLPTNPKDQQCLPIPSLSPTLPVISPQPSISPNCNALCRSDLECTNGLICYFGANNTQDSGWCRLKENPTSQTCSPIISEQPWLNFSARLQGLRKPKIAMKSQVTLVPLNRLNPAADVIPKQYVFDSELISTQSGELSPTNKLLLKDLPIDQKYAVFVKTSWSLRRKIGEITIKSGENTLSSDWARAPLLVGDFVTTPPEQNNRINLLDLSAMIRAYTKLVIPVSPTNQLFDVNFDNQIDILDLSLVLSNYTQLEVAGD